MTRKRSLQESIKTIHKIQESYSPQTNFYKELEVNKDIFKSLLDKEIKLLNKKTKALTKK